MRIGVPGQVLAVDIHQLAQGEKRVASNVMSILLLIWGSVPADLIGQWVLVHVGFGDEHH